MEEQGDELHRQREEAALAEKRRLKAIAQAAKEELRRALAAKQLEKDEKAAKKKSEKIAKKTSDGSEKRSAKLASKRSKGAARAASGPSSVFAFGASATPSFPAFSFTPFQPAQPGKTIDCKTDIDLTGYRYGAEPATSTGKLDLVFCLDCTGSMSSVIRGCQTSIVELVNTLTHAEGQDVRFALIPYRDHHSNEQYCTKVYPFTRDVDQMLLNVNGQSANGGGDSPEAVAAALFEAVCLDWRDDAAKLVVVMADAPPHGLGALGDIFPKGDPDGKDPLSIGREMVSLGISVYSLLARGYSVQTLNFFACLSNMTGGQCMALNDCALLGNVVLSGAQETVDIENRMSAVRQRRDEAARTKGSALTDVEAAAITHEVLTASDVAKTRELPADKLLLAAEIVVERAADPSSTVVSLQDVWAAPGPSSAGLGSGSSFFSSLAPTSTASAAAAAAPVRMVESLSARVSKMAKAREGRPTDKIIVECVAEGSKVRARVVSAGYDPEKNCQFPRSIREVGKRFLVDTIVDAGSFYQAKGNIVEME